MPKQFSQNFSLGLALGLHIALGLLLILSFEHTIRIPPAPSVDENKEIIEAVVVNKKSLQDEVDRLAMIEAKRKQQEQAKKQELIRQENEIKQKREKEEQLLVELKKKNEQLKKEAELQRLVKEQQEQELKDKVKAEQENLKKIQKQKEEAIALAAKNKAIVEQKAQELAKQEEQARQKQKELADQMAKQAANARINQNEISRFMSLMQNKIHQNWRQPLGFNFNGYKCKILVKLMPTGDVIEAYVIEKSGSIEFDTSAVVAIKKASPLPMPDDPSVANQFREFSFTFNPEAA